MANNLRPTNNGAGDSIQCPTLANIDYPRLAAAGAIAVTGYSLITFDADSDGLQINNGTTVDATNYHKLPACAAYAIGDGVTSVYVNGAVGYFIR